MPKILDEISVAFDSIADFSILCDCHNVDCNDCRFFYAHECQITEVKEGLRKLRKLATS